MIRIATFTLLFVFWLGAQQAPYYPGTHDSWERRTPEKAGFDAQKLQAAIDFAKSRESRAPRDLERAHFISNGREPHDQPVGPFQPRGDMSGVILRNGYLVAEWGDPWRVEMTFSVTKSFVSTTVGLAYDRGLIKDLNDPVKRYVPSGYFDTEHNAKITWDHLLRQTSDWEGTLWSKPDWADRPPANQPLGPYIERKRNEPGTVYKYNDVRVNLLALAALHVWRRPLPDVLRDLVMDPIGASNTWLWHGYETSWVTMGGARVQSVSGGGHWGGGMFISARDLARFGLFTMNRGQWRDRPLLSEKWFQMATTPTPAEPGYGFMNFFLNTGKKRFKTAPESSFVHLGSGTNMVYVDRENGLVVVARWIEQSAMPEFIERVLASAAAR